MNKCVHVCKKPGKDSRKANKDAYGYNFAQTMMICIVRFECNIEKRVYTTINTDENYLHSNQFLNTDENSLRKNNFLFSCYQARTT